MTAVLLFAAHALWHVLLLSPLLALVAWWRSTPETEEAPECPKT